MINILIADDHPIVRNGLKQIIADETDMQVICEASNAEQIFQLLETHSIDLIVLDISMPGQNGFDALIKLRESNSKIPVIILSVHNEDIFARRAFEMGAEGYIDKECAPEELVSAIRRIKNGGKYLSHKLAESIATWSFVNKNKMPHEILSAREFQIFLQIGSGKTVSQIAAILNLGINTVSTYRKRIVQKTGLKNNTEILFYCINNKLVINEPASQKNDYQKI